MANATFIVYRIRSEARLDYINFDVCVEDIDPPYETISKIENQPHTYKQSMYKRIIFA